jgi:hypothetical protein
MNEKKTKEHICQSYTGSYLDDAYFNDWVGLSSGLY